jgi:predicted ATPase
VVTLTGPGGTGKTSLAAALGAELLSSFADGVFFVDLSALTDTSLVVAQVAAVFNLIEGGGRSLAAALHDYLSSKDMLLLLDNFEQLMAAAPEVAALASAAPQVRVLVTSREPLHVAGEVEVAVPPLVVPSHTPADLQELQRSSAVALFLERARRVRADFTLTAENAADVATICRRLDGLPLALELAAARVKVLTPSVLLERLEHSLKVLSSARRDASDRQRTLRGAIAWSYDLLSPDEQTLFRCLGVFAGGWSLEAVEKVCERAGVDLDVLDGLGSLVDKNLVRGMQQDDDRFSMLQTIREFASEKLDESAEGERIRRAHAEFFRMLADYVYSVPRGEETETRHLDRLEDDHENLRSALSWALEAEPALALGLASSLGRYWYVRGYLREGRAWLERVLAGSDTGGLRTEPTRAAISLLSALSKVISGVRDPRRRHRSTSIAP